MKYFSGNPCFPIFFREILEIFCVNVKWKSDCIEYVSESYNDDHEKSHSLENLLFLYLVRDPMEYAGACLSPCGWTFSGEYAPGDGVLNVSRSYKK